MDMGNSSLQIRHKQEGVVPTLGAALKGCQAQDSKMRQAPQVL